MNKLSTSEELKQTLSGQTDYFILEELLEDAEDKIEILTKYQVIVEIKQASHSDRQKVIKKWAKKLHKHERTIKRLVQKVNEEGLSALVRKKRNDAGQLTGSIQWKRNGEEQWRSREEGVTYWTEFIINTYKKANKASRRISPHQVYIQVKSHAELDLDLKEGEYPSHVFVYKVLEPLIPDKQPRIRRPNQGPGIVIKCYSKYSKNEKTLEEIVVTRSNQLWQIDHTKLDDLLIDANGDSVGTLWITAIIDSYSGCIMGYHTGFDAAGSHEVGLALRHAILPKHYSQEYHLQKEWEVCGIPEYIVTDNAKEFHSNHLKRIAVQLGIKLRYRAYTEQGGLVERVFLNLKTEVAALLPGYKGGSLKERPHDSDKYACLSFEEYEKLLVRYFVDHHNCHPYPRRKDQTRLMVWHNGLAESTQVPEERALDICLLKQTGKRKVQAYGTINCFATIYGAGWVKDEEGLMRYNEEQNFLLPYHGCSVVLRYNPDNIVYVLVYTPESEGQPSQYLGTIRARDLEEERLSLKEWESRKKKIRNQAKQLDLSPILKERKDLMAFSEQKLTEQRRKQKKSKKQRRRMEQERITQKTRPSNLVTFPLENKPSSSTQAIQSQDNQVCLEQVKSTPETIVEESSPLMIISDWDDFVDSNW